MRPPLSMGFLVRESFRSMRENRWTALLTSLTVCFSLSIFAVFVVVFVNLGGAMGRIGDRTHVVVYIKGQAADAESLRRDILGIDGVKSVTYVSRDEALEELKAGLKGYEGMLEGIDSTNNPLPASFEIKVAEAYRDTMRIHRVAERLKRFPWVEEVQYGAEWVEKFGAFLRFLEGAAFVLGGFLLAATVFVITNTIRLTIYARRDELEVMSLVGASPLFIRIPFIIEGVVQGALGGLLSLAFLFLGRNAIASKIPPYLDFVVSIPYPPLVLLAVLVSAGATLGVIGSLISMERFLRV